MPILALLYPGNAQAAKSGENLQEFLIKNKALVGCCLFGSSSLLKADRYKCSTQATPV